jgi:hypothetical protein
VTLPWYATREMVKSALDIMETARANGQIDRALDAGARQVEGLTHRRFYPWTGTRYFDWPNGQYSEAWRLWLGVNELISINSVVVAGTTLPESGYLPRRSDDRDEAPCTHLEVDLASSSAFSSGSTHQRQIAITGVFGEGADETPAGALAETLDASETGVDISDSAAIGIGDLIRVDDERMIVTGKTMLTTGQALQTPLTALNNNVTLAVTDGAAYSADEVILLDSERMLIGDIAGNNLTVRRAWDGSTLAAHTGSTIYAPRTLTVERGALGTAAAAHSSSAALHRHRPPGPVRDLNLAYAINQLLQEGAGYARVAGSGDNAREFTGRGIAALEDAVRTRYGRMARLEAV